MVDQQLAADIGPQVSEIKIFNVCVKKYNILSF